MSKKDGENPNPERPAPDTKPGGQQAEAQQAGSGPGGAVGGSDQREGFGAKPGDLGPVQGDTEASKERGVAQRDSDRGRRRPSEEELDPALDPNHPEPGAGDVEVSFPADKLGGVDWNKVAESMGDFHVGGDSTNEGGRRTIRFAPGAAEEPPEPTQQPA